MMLASRMPKLVSASRWGNVRPIGVLRGLGVSPERVLSRQKELGRDAQGTFKSHQAKRNENSFAARASNRNRTAFPARRDTSLAPSVHSTFLSRKSPLT